MLYLNDILIAGTHPLSIQRLKKHKLPNVYHATSIADFLKEKQEVLPTPNKLCMARHDIGSVVIHFSVAGYEKKHNYVETGFLWEEDFKFAHMLRNLDKISDREPSDENEQIIESMHEEFHNGLLVDQTQETPVRYFGPVPNRKLYNIWTKYYPQWDIHILGRYDFHGPPAQGTATPELSLRDVPRLTAAFSPA